MAVAKEFEGIKNARRKFEPITVALRKRLTLVVFSTANIRIKNYTATITTEIKKSADFRLG